MYKKVTGYDPVGMEKRVIEFWNDNDVFKKSIASREGGEEFSFYDGPPTANGKPHVGHVLTRTMKDIIPRFHTMKGKHVLRKAGWDTHGLPVELEVEKSLNIDGKQDIEKFGVEPFIANCKKSVWKYKSEWERMSERVGYWADMENPYVTYDDNYIESVWWSLKTIFDRGLIYKGHKVVPYCPRCGTALSSHEVAQGYKDVTERTAVVGFDSEFEGGCKILAWTTTPWTLPSNVALCVNPDYEYVLIQAAQGKFVLAKELAGKHFEEYKILKSFTGKQLVGVKYAPLYATYEGSDAYRIVADGYVTLSDGTGIVHIAPAFGEDDARVGRDNGLPFVKTVDERGRVTGVGAFDGLFCKDADKEIIIDLKKRGLLLSSPQYTHSYPFCWRCNTPLLYYARSTWFVKTTAVKDELIKNNASVNWYPQSIGTGRMGNFLENVIDWGLSRDRYWGTPLPIWVCDKCGKTEAIGSKAELKQKCDIKGDIELHKPYVDGATYKCSCGGTMHRTPEVIDCWYDSGSMPFAQYHYPFENKDVFEKTFPADFISEAVDQTRGWFYTLLVISTLLFGKAPFKNCLVLGHVTDEQGRKQSKHLGNVVDPWSVLDAAGADAVRWYYYTNSAPYLPSRFYMKAVTESQNKFLGTLYNTYAFYVMYAEIDGFDPTKVDGEKGVKYSLMDKWVLSELNTLVKKVDEDLTAYKLYESARAIGDFTELLSNWYVRRCRERYWAGGMSDDKTAAFYTLYTVLQTLCRISAPYVPFITEEIYQNIVRSVDKKAPLSVHTADFPKANKKLIDSRLSVDMERVIKAAELGRAARNKSGIKNRQTLAKAIVDGEFPEEYSYILADELNVKEIVKGGSDELTEYEVKPQLKTVGPKYGKAVGAIRNHLAENGNAAARTALAGNVYAFEIGGEKIELTKDDMLISTRSAEGYSAESDLDMTVALDVTLTDELLKEGAAREIISKIQTLRKSKGFDVTDRIKLYYAGDGFIEEVFKAHGERIAKVTLAQYVEHLDAPLDEIEQYTDPWDINGYYALLVIEKC